MSDGDYRSAGQAFEELAMAGEQQGAERSPKLYLQAGRAWIRAGEPARGLDRLRHGFRLMLRTGGIAAMGVVLARVVGELQQAGLGAEAAALESEFAPELTLTEPEAAQPPQMQLPSKCPQCGATVRPTEVELLDDGRASCEYCGSVLSPGE